MSTQVEIFQNLISASLDAKPELQDFLDTAGAIVANMSEDDILELTDGTPREKLSDDQLQSLACIRIRRMLRTEIVAGIQARANILAQVSVAAAIAASQERINTAASDAGSPII